ncbi:ABC transporter permease [Gilvimarinus sp. SDUM040013]|uniref:ABC transporter permease n=1 Tax=Gilvimarinus gilvus TaxID=3058038 RepID=A0ABU4S2X2_9GAMM|nr:ABC transporter permease [Gilvimarinus sp. SDUM040013]MDO3384693.1 ABC transporter permease [Gilvimarinus sp. SDUM040013]MDX6850832.1 ABC transporter permease [Gilvimarinus sp. SDUM040013]
MWFKQLRAVWNKELGDAVRDKRAMKIAFLPPVYMVLFFAVGIGFAIHLQNNEERDIEIHLAGQDAPLEAWLTENSITLNPAPEDPYGAVESGEVEFVLVLNTEPVAAGSKEPRSATMVYNASNQSVHGSVGEVRRLLYQYNSMEAGINILARGLSPKLINPVSVREANVASDQQMGGLILGGVPLLLLMCAMMGSVGFAVDMTAGERERHSLEPLLINPVPSMTLILGKWLAAVALTLAVVLVCILLMSIALYFLPFDKIGLRVSVSAGAMLGVFLSLMPIAAIAAALQLVLGILSRSFKDAQTYMSFLIVLPMVPFFVVVTNPGIYETWHLWVPMLGHQTVLRNLLLGEGAEFMAFIAFTVSAIPVVLIALWLAAKQVRRAKIIYG